MVSELTPPVLESQLGSQNFMPPLILNTNFIKGESKIAYLYDSGIALTENLQSLELINRYLEEC